MGFQSQYGQVGFKTQAQKGTFAAPGDSGTPGVFARILGGALSGNRELIIPDPEIGGGRDVPDAYLGPIVYTGEYEFYPRAEMIAVLLYAALGDKTSTSVGDPGDEHYSHVISPIDTGALPWLSIEEAISDSYEVFNYTDAKVNTLHLECDAQGYLRGSVGLVALTQEAGKARTATPEWDVTPLFVGSNITVEFDGDPLPAKSFSFDINNNLEDDDFRLGSVTLGDTTEKRREMTIGVTVRPEDKDLWRLATYGSASATAPLAGAAAKGPVVITIETYEKIAGSGGTTPYTILLSVPQATIRPFAVTPSGDDVIEHEMEIQALRPDPSDPILTATVLNGASAVA